MKKGLLLAIFNFLIMISSITTNNASATCQITGHVIYTIQSATLATVYVAPATFMPSFYYVYTLAPATLSANALINKINAAQTTGARVVVVGSADTCGTTGTMRAGGTILTVVTGTLF